MVWDFNKFSMDDLLNVDEREQAIGFHISITTMLDTFCRSLQVDFKASYGHELHDMDFQSNLG